MFVISSGLDAEPKLNRAFPTGSGSSPRVEDLMQGVSRAVQVRVRLESSKRLS